MKRLMCFLFLVLPLLLPITSGAEHRVTVDSVVNSAGVDSIRADEDVQFLVRVTNTNGSGCTYNPTFSWTIYSPDGAEWDSTTLQTLEGSSGTTFDALFNNFFTEGWGLTGSGADSIGAAGITFSPGGGTGLFDDFDTLAFSITIHPSQESAGRTICLDTLGRMGPVGFEWTWWMFPFCTDVVPDWDGPYCYTVVGPAGDIDGDGVPDGEDNCPSDYNPDQSDVDQDGLGDVCDPKNDFTYEVDQGDSADIFALVTADMDRDNHTDLLYTGNSVPGLFIAYGTPNDSLETPVSLLDILQADLTVNYLDNDTLFDIIAVTNDQIYTFVNLGQYGVPVSREYDIDSTANPAGGGFATRSVNRQEEELIPSVTSGYYNDDAFLDLAITPDLLLFGNGDGSFGSTGSLPVSASYLNTADFNNDGSSDLLAVVVDSALVLTNGGTGVFSATRSIFIDTGYGRVPVTNALAEINGNSFIDCAVVAANVDSSGQSLVTIGLGNSEEGLDVSQTLVIDGVVHNVTLTDVDRDNLLDLVASNGTSMQLEIYPGDGAGMFGTPDTVYLGESGGFTFALSMADFDRDGHPDFVTGGLDSGNILIGTSDLQDQDVLEDEMTVTGYGHLEVGIINPNGFVITESFQTVAGSDFWRYDVDGDGTLDTRTIDYNLEYGEYGVIIRLRPGYDPGEPLRVGIGIDGSQQREIAVSLGLFDLNKSGQQTSADSVIFYFTHEEESSILPANGLPTRHSRPTFDWTALADPGAVSFQFQLDPYYNFRAPRFDSTGLEQPLFITPTPLGGDSVYYWRFRSFDGVDWSSYSRTFAAYILYMECGWFNSGLTGNANCSEDGKVTLSDVTAVIDRVYISKRPLCCDENGNANGSLDGMLTLSDISRLIDHVFISKGPTEPCL